MVFTPCGHGNGAYSAIHLMTLRPNVGLGANDFCPITPRNESARWHTIWCADIFPHRRWLSTRTRPTRSSISFRHCASASVLMLTPASFSNLPAFLSPSPTLQKRTRRVEEKSPLTYSHIGMYYQPMARASSTSD